VPLNEQKGDLIFNDSSNVFYNNFSIELGTFIKSMKIQEFHAFPKVSSLPDVNTYLNVSDVGIKLNEGKLTLSRTANKKEFIDH
jgi:hypothetical protein